MCKLGRELVSFRSPDTESTSNVALGIVDPHAQPLGLVLQGGWQATKPMGSTTYCNKGRWLLEMRLISERALAPDIESRPTLTTQKLAETPPSVAMKAEKARRPSEVVEGASAAVQQVARPIGLARSVALRGCDGCLF